MKPVCLGSLHRLYINMDDITYPKVKQKRLDFHLVATLQVLHPASSMLLHGTWNKQKSQNARQILYVREGFLCIKQDLDIVAPSPDLYYTDAGYRLRQWHKMTLFVSGIFWLHYWTYSLWFIVGVGKQIRGEIMRQTFQKTLLTM